jgi:hypothetical protein
MVSNINDFKSSFTRDLAKSSKFDVIIPVPVPLILQRNKARNLTYRCEEAQLPGRTLSTAELKIGSSPNEKYPYGTTFTDIDLTFIVDDSMDQKTFFDSWINYINPSYSWNLRYKEDYASTITINQYDANNKKIYSVNLYEAFPISMNQMDLSWGSEGYHKLVVTFAYTSWSNADLDLDDLANLAIAGLVDSFSEVENEFTNMFESAVDSLIPIDDSLDN